MSSTTAHRSSGKKRAASSTSATAADLTTTTTTTDSSTARASRNSLPPLIAPTSSSLLSSSSSSSSSSSEVAANKRLKMTMSNLSKHLTCAISHELSKIMPIQPLKLIYPNLTLASIADQWSILSLRKTATPTSAAKFVGGSTRKARARWTRAAASTPPDSPATAWRSSRLKSLWRRAS